MDYQVLLYYKYVTIKDPEQLRDQQKALCTSLHLKGRIIVATEGINGTLEGTIEETTTYIDEMKKDARFADITYKKSTGTGTAFPKLSVKVRKEIVTTGIEGLDPTRLTGKYITVDELHRWFTEKKEFTIVDMRNEYEYISGHFVDSEFSGLNHFFQLSDVIPRLQHLKGKTIVTVCTGGVRCEKASGFLLQEGFADVYQLKEGIQTYMEKYPNEHFNGKLYVFDNRLTIAFNTDDDNHVIVGKCLHCGTPCDTYVNCGYNFCHSHFICCTDCMDEETTLAFCKPACKQTYAQQ